MAETLSEWAKSLWQAWRRVAHGIGNFQTQAFLGVLYAVALFPFGICLRLFADTLHTKQRPTQWRIRPPEILDMPWAHKQ